MARGYYNVPVVGGIATPDLSQGNIQAVPVSGDTLVLAPSNLAPGPFWLKFIWATSDGVVSLSSDFIDFAATFGGSGTTANSVIQMLAGVQSNLQISPLGIIQTSIAAPGLTWDEDSLTWGEETRTWETI